MNVSNINSLATVTWEDFLSPMIKKTVKDKQQLNCIKYLAFMYAIIIMGIAFSVGLLSGVIESAMLTSSATTGPLVGVFILAMLIPIANGKVSKKKKCFSIKRYFSSFTIFIFHCNIKLINLRVKIKTLRVFVFSLLSAAQGAVTGMIVSNICTIILICGNYAISRRSTERLQTSTEVIM